MSVHPTAQCLRCAVGAIFVTLTLMTAACGDPSSQMSSPEGVPSETTTAEPAATPSSSTSSSRPSASASESPSSEDNALRPSVAVAPPAPRGGFSLVVQTAAGDLPARVAPFSVGSYELVDPPHETAEQWNTAAWVKQSAYPSVPSTGTSYVYGHACHEHVCPFTNLKAAKVGDRVIVTTPDATLTYKVRRIGLSSKSARSLPAWASDSAVPDRVVLVTCKLEPNSPGRDNIVVVAGLVS